MSRKECADVKAAAETAAASAEANLKVAKGQRDELESDLKDTKRIAQVGLLWPLIHSSMRVCFEHAPWCAACLDST